MIVGAPRTLCFERDHPRSSTPLFGAVVLSMLLMMTTAAWAKKEVQFKDHVVASHLSKPAAMSDRTTLSSSPKTIGVKNTVTATPVVPFDPATVVPRSTVVSNVVAPSNINPTLLLKNRNGALPSLNASTSLTKGINTAPRSSWGNWFGGYYEVFDRPGTNASRVYRSNSAFATARWLMDHQAYHVPHRANVGYELRTSSEVLDMGSPDLDRWIEQHR